MDLDPDAFYPVANLIGITQLEWEVQDNNPWGMQPDLELTWGPDGVSEQTLLVTVPLNPLFQIVLRERTLFIAFSASIWLDSLPFQLATCYVNEWVQCIHTFELLIARDGSFGLLLCAYLWSKESLDFARRTPTMLHVVWITQGLSNIHELPRFLSGLRISGGDMESAFMTLKFLELVRCGTWTLYAGEATFLQR